MLPRGSIGNTCRSTATGASARAQAPLPWDARSCEPVPTHSRAASFHRKDIVQLTQSRSVRSSPGPDTSLDAAAAPISMTNGPVLLMLGGTTGLRDPPAGVVALLNNAHGGWRVAAVQSGLRLSKSSPCRAGVRVEELS